MSSIMPETPPHFVSPERFQQMVNSLKPTGVFCICGQLYYATADLELILILQSRGYNVELDKPYCPNCDGPDDAA